MTQEIDKVRRYLTGAIFFAPLIIAAGCRDKLGPPSLSTEPVLPGPENDGFSEGDMETIFLLLADPDMEIKVQPSPLILKLAGFIHQGLTAIKTSIENGPAEANAPQRLSQIDRLGQITDQQPIDPAEIENLADIPHQNQWQAITALLYIQGLLLRKNRQDQQAFNVLCSVRMLAQPLQTEAQQKSWSDYLSQTSLSETAVAAGDDYQSRLSFLFNFAAANVNSQLSSLVAEGHVSTHDITQEFFRDVLLGVDAAKFEALMKKAREAEKMPAKTEKELEEKRKEIELCLANFYVQMSHGLLARGLFASDEERKKWLKKDKENGNLGGGLAKLTELFPLITTERDLNLLSPETLSYSYLVQRDEDIIVGSTFDANEESMSIANVSLTAIQNYLKSMGVPCNAIHTLASIRQDPNHKDLVADLGDEETVAYAKSQEIVLLDNCSFHQVVDTSSAIPSVEWHTVIALRSANVDKLMLAVPQTSSSDIIRLTGSSEHFISSKKFNDVTVAGYQITTFLDFLQEFYSNPSLQQETSLTPSQLIATSTRESLETLVQPGQYAVYIPPETPIHVLTSEKGDWVVTSTHPSEKDKPNFGDMGTLFTLSEEGKKITAIDPQTSASADYYILETTPTGTIVAIKASETAAFEQRTFLQYLYNSPHRMLFLLALLGNFPVAISQKKLFPFGTIEAATGSSILYTIDGIIRLPQTPAPAGLTSLSFKLLHPEGDARDIKGLLSGLPIEVLTKNAETEASVEETVGFKLIKNSVLVKALQILQAVSAYLLIKQLTKEQKSNLHTMIEAAAPYLANRSDLFDPNLWNDYGVQIMPFQNNLIWQSP